MGSARLHVQLLSLSYFRDRTSSEYAWCAHGLHVLRAYAMRVASLRERVRIHVGAVCFGDRDRLVPERGSSPGEVARFLDPDADVLGLSCEPWSVAWVEEVMASARRLRPDTRLWVGGDAVDLLLDRGRVRWTPGDLIIRGGAGQAERPFVGALRLLLGRDRWSDEALGRVPGLSWWSANRDRMESSGPPAYLPLRNIPSPYSGAGLPTDPLYDTAYIRASRGCPGRCRYCSEPYALCGSGSLDLTAPRRFRRELDLACGNGCRRLILLCSALNHDSDHMRALFAAMGGRRFTDVHAVLQLHRLDRTQTDILLRQPAGVLTMSMGVQSLSPGACRAVRRPHMDLPAIKRRLGPLTDHGRIHLDVIFPLPGETLGQFKRHVESLVALPGVRVCANQLYLPPDSAFGRDPGRWGFESQDVEGMRFAVACARFERDDVREAQEWLRAASDGERLVVADAGSWARHCQRPGRDPT